MYVLTLGFIIFFVWNQADKYFYRLEHPLEYAWYKKVDVAVSGVHFTADVADTEELRTQGLSGRASLGKHRAMLFVFDHPAEYPFWMRGMFMAIDIIWIDSDKRIIHMEKNVSPKSFPENFKPRSDALYVLEFPSGTVEAIKMKEGDSVKISI